MSLTPAFLDEVRARTQLSALIGKSVKVQRAGREWRACCPFHDEKTPSFYVNDDKGFGHCFGCSWHGDAIRWLTDHRGLPFIDAVKELAHAAGLEMPERDRQAAERADRARGLHEAMADAEAWFTVQLAGIEGADARRALECRGMTAETTRAFGIGFAPDSRGKLKLALNSIGDTKLVEAGLLIQIEGKEPYDRFRGRLMIPIRDARGRTIAFGGRVIGEGEPKYLNSPDTPLFDKGRTLYNLDRAAAASRKSGRIIAVEGYMDVIALAQAGFGEAVAPLGTALTEHQIERLWRMADVPLLCFDGDSAGQKAAVRAAHRALPLLQPGRSLAFVTLPDGMDPDDLVRTRGAAAFEALLKAPQQLADRIWSHEVAVEALDTPEARAGLKRRLSELANTVAEPSVRSEYHAEFRRRFDALFASRPRRHRPAATSVATLGPDVSLARAAVVGLVRYPSVALNHLEDLAVLGSMAGELGTAFEAMIDLAISHPHCDCEAAVAALSSRGIDVQALTTKGGLLPFGFTRESSDQTAAIAELSEVLSVMARDAAIRSHGGSSAPIALAQARRALEEEVARRAEIRRAADLESVVDALLSK